jgi:hypothetical protein
MAIPKELSPQTDFSAGQLNVDMKRSDSPILKSGARQMVNWRLRNSGRPQQRPGRRVQLLMGSLGRVDEVLVLPSTVYRLEFTNLGELIIYDSAGTFVAGAVGQAWRTETVWQIVWTLVRTGGTTCDVLVLFPGQRPLVARFDGVAGWTFPPFTFAIGNDLIALPPYYRVVALGATMTVTAPVGGVLLTASAPVFKPEHVLPNPSIIRFANRRLLPTAYIDPQNIDATWFEGAYPFQRLTITAITGHINVPDPGFSVGQIVQGSVSNCQGEITHLDPVNHYIYVQCTNSYEGFSGTENVASATGAATITAVTNATYGLIDGTPQPTVTTWDEQMISDARGWPASCSTDQGRLILCDLPSTPEGIIWSAINQPYNLEVGAQPTQAMVEIISGKPRVYHVVAGDGGELVFTDRGIKYIPISETNPLIPGSVVFRDVSPEAASKVRPLRLPEGMLYVNAGRSRIVALIGSGATYSVKPYEAHDVSRYHYDLFNSIAAIAYSTGDGTFPERYIYATNGDGTIAVGRWEFTSDKNWIGWVPWTSSAFVNWVSVLQSTVMLTSQYPSFVVAETLDDTTYLDASVSYFAVPSAIAPHLTAPPSGPLWWLPGQTVHLMDGVKYLGTRQVNQQGFIDPVEGEDLKFPALIAGLPWQATLEPFVPHMQGGQSVQQRLRRRRIARLGISVERSTGFVFAKLYSGPEGAMLPAPGTVVQSRRIPAYNVGDNGALAPPVRERTYAFRTTGRRHDPRVALIKDTPGPVRVLEIGIDVTI